MPRRSGLLGGVAGIADDRIWEELDFKKMQERVNDIARKALERLERELAAKLEANKAERGAPVKRAEAVFGGELKSGRGKSDGKKQRNLLVLDQWVEVEIEEGHTVTRLYPSNEELIKQGRAMERIPDLVYRRLNFPRGIPEEYGWSTSNPDRRERGGMGTQRMTVETWLDVIEREAASGTGHVGPTGVGNLPRPKERGGCECELCVRNREVLERRAEG